MTIKFSNIQQTFRKVPKTRKLAQQAIDTFFSTNTKTE